MAYCQGCQSIANIVLARNLHGYGYSHFGRIAPGLEDHGKCKTTSLINLQTARMIVCRWFKAKSPYFSGSQCGACQTEGSRVISADEEVTSGLNAAHKINKCLAVILRGREAIRMIVFYCVDHGKIRLKSEKHSVIFVCFDYKDITFACMSIARKVFRNTANDIAGVFTKSSKHPGDHCSGRRLTVCASNRNTQMPLH